MHKSTFFTGQPIFSQLVKLIPKGEVERIARQAASNRYCKKFDTWHHLITMLYGCYQHCTSLREITTGMSACEGRLQSLSFRHFTRKSTFSDANKRRDADVFEDIYQMLYKRLSPNLPDSRMKGGVFKKLFIIDSTTISLFSNIYKGVGPYPINGKKKGGLKIHMAVQSSQDVPCLIRITKGATDDRVFAKQIQLPKGSYAVFDKGYHSYRYFNELDKNGVSWVTRPRYNTAIKVTKEYPVNEAEYQLGVRKDEQILMGHPDKHIIKVISRRITFYDSVNKRNFEFITNNNRVKASTVAAIYKQRWQIELLFKRLKQNMPLQYFIGDNQNAIKIQIWCTLIADLLLKAATVGIKRSWAFSNLSSLIRLHLMNYTDLKRFLNNPEKAKITMPVIENKGQLKLFSG
jgi:transposase